MSWWYDWAGPIAKRGCLQATVVHWMVSLETTQTPIILTTTAVSYFELTLFKPRIMRLYLGDNYIPATMITFLWSKPSLIRQIFYWVPG